MSKPQVSIVMGSDSDLEIMREAGKALEGFGIEYEIDVTSAHRSPDRSADFARKAASRGIRVIIAGAGGAAHLAGVIAAHTILPVIGVPIPSTSLNGMDSLLSTVQMPAGIPVATVAIGKPGATNAGILAAQIIGVADTGIAKKLDAHKDKLAKGVGEIKEVEGKPVEEKRAMSGEPTSCALLRYRCRGAVTKLGRPSRTRSLNPLHPGLPSWA